ncbi:MAG: serine hydrolase domain-containing protein [Robiginitalea sp.]|uniref:serine hydrolase domain-containing protein n=1 Tax=Robiginitalea sp. TaxID=1902411 RepID=UPI003C77C3CB
MRYSIYLFLLIFIARAGLAQTGESPNEALTDTLEAICDSGALVGFSVALVDAEGVQYVKGFGSADLAAQKAYDIHTIQNIASISKTFIGIALLKAQEMGQLDLDDPVNNYLPFEVIHPYFPEIPITLRHLVTHTSGITDPDEYDAKGYILRNAENGEDAVYANFLPPSHMLSLEDFQQRILSKDGQWYRKKTFLKKKPGGRFEYSNIGAGLAALALEKATETPFNDFTRTYIFQPLEMSHSGWFPSEVDFSKHSRTYTDTGIPLAPYSLVNFPDGGLMTSAEDLGKYLSELIRGYSGNGKILTPESFKELFTPQLQAAQFTSRSDGVYNDEYNMGVFMGFSSHDQIGHTGGDPGVSTFMFFNAKTLTGKLLLVNTDLNQKGVETFKEIWKTLETFEGQF